MKIHAMQVSSLAVSSGGKKASSWRPDMDWNMILFCSLCYLHKKREYCITLLAHPCPVVFLRGQYPCLVSTVSCFFLSLLPFHFHFPSPLPCATYLCVDHIGSLLHLSHPLSTPPGYAVSLLSFFWSISHVLYSSAWACGQPAKLGSLWHQTHFSKIRLAIWELSQPMPALCVPVFTLSYLVCLPLVHNVSSLSR